MATKTSDQKTETRVNRLYWESDLSVNAIGQELALSKGRLYELLRPLPTGLGCPKCGGELGFDNRTARDRGTVTCPRCGFEGSRKEAQPEPSEGSELAPLPDGAGRQTPAVVSTILGGLAVGTAAGLLLGRVLRR